MSLSGSLLGGRRDVTSTLGVRGPRLLLLFITLSVKYLQASSCSQVSRSWALNSDMIKMPSLKSPTRSWNEPNHTAG